MCKSSSNYSFHANSQEIYTYIFQYRLRGFSSICNRRVSIVKLVIGAMWHLLIALVLLTSFITTAHAYCWAGPTSRIATNTSGAPANSIHVKMCGAFGGSYNLDTHSAGISDLTWCTDGTTTEEDIQTDGSTASGIIANVAYYQSTDSTETIYPTEKSCLNACPEGTQFDTDTETCVPVEFYLSGSSTNNACEGNPCNPVTGNKFQTETDLDLSGSGLSLHRYYQSQSLGDGFKGLGNKWRHDFTPRLDSYEDTADYVLYKQTKSELYLSSNEACLLGWADIKAEVYRGALALNSLAYYRKGHCEIEQNGEVVAIFSIHSTAQFADGQSLLKKTISRPNGEKITFSRNGSAWETINPSVVSLEDLTIAWQFTDVDDTVEVYGIDGLLQLSTTQNGWVTSFSYDSFNRLATVTGPFGHQLVFNYDIQNRIETVITPLGIISYGYDANNNLNAVTYPDSRVKQYHYEDINYPQYLTGITDENTVRYATWNYDSQGRSIVSVHNGGADWVGFVYNSDGTTTVTDSRGSSRIYHTIMRGGELKVDNLTGVPCLTCASGKMMARDYDSEGNLIEFTDWQGVITQFGNYDLKVQYAYMIEAVGTTEERRIDYNYDSRFLNKVISKTEPSIFSGNNKVTTTVYDAFGNPTSITVAGFNPSGDSVSRSIAAQYNGPINQLSFIDGPRIDVDDYTYYRYYPNDSIEGNNRGRLKEVEDATGVLIQSNIQYTATGKIESETRANGLALSYTYYSGNDRIETLTQATAAGFKVTKLSYLNTGEVETITTAFGSIDDTTLTLGYDSARRLNKITDGLGNYISYVLDTEGNHEEEKIFDAGDNLKRHLTQAFDIYNLLDTSNQANESRNLGFSSDGTLDIETDGKNVTTDYSYDNLKRLTQINQDMGGTSAQTANALTILNYDVQDNLTYVKNPVNGETVYTYDDLGNQLTRTSDDTGLTSYSHDDAGNITSMLDANGETTTYTYDALNRLTSITASNADDNYQYEYDNCQNGSGRLCKVSNTTSAQHYSYAAFGNVTSQQALQYTYDTANRLHIVSYPSGAIVYYDYDAAGQVVQVILERNGTTVPLAADINYEAFGDVANLRYGNNLSLLQDRDTAYRPVSQQILSVFELRYSEYDDNGNLKRRADDIAGTSAFFEYDAHNRLNDATGDFGVRSYEYDKNANRTKLTEDSVQTSSAYHPASNRLSMRGVDNANLDNNGNMLDLGDRGYSYTKHNRLFEVFDSGVLKATYRYNGLGQRISKTLPDGTGKYFIYDTDGKLMAETDINGNVLFEYIYLNGQLLAKYTPDSDSDGISNYEEHQQGTNPLSPDSDSDGLSDLVEIFVHGTAVNNADTDGDGLSDSEEITLNSDPLNGSANIGDINLDGEFNLGDYVLLTQFVLDIRTPTPTEQEQADINLDGVLNIQDMLLMQRVLLGLQVSWSDITVDNVERFFAQIYQGIIPPAYAANGDGEIYYVHNDHLGTPVKMTNEIGQVVWQAVYDPFGKATVDEDVDGDGKAVEMNVRFPGQYYDVESGLHYNYFRTYDPELGRYITSDPIGLFGGVNTFGYVGGNPVKWFDSKGLDVEGAIKGAHNSINTSNVYSDAVQFVESNGRVGNANDLQSGQIKFVDNLFETTVESMDALYRPLAKRKIQSVTGRNKLPIDPIRPNLNDINEYDRSTSKPGMCTINNAHLYNLMLYF